MKTIFVPLADQNILLTLSSSFMEQRDMRLGEVRSPRSDPEPRVLMMVDTQRAETGHSGPTLPEGVREGFPEKVTLGEVLQDE